MRTMLTRVAMVHAPREATMKGLRFRLQLTLILSILVVCSLGAQAPASAQALDGWSFLVTPQVWISHIAKNGFAAAPNATTVGPFFVFQGNGDIVQNPFPSTSSPNEDLNPQWGIQLAAQKDRWTLAFAFQYVTFETRNDITYVDPQNRPTCDPIFGTVCINSGERWAQEFVDTTRMDVDLSASYFFPGVVKDRLDVSLGAGFKFIYASASRQYANLSPTAALLSSAGTAPPPGFSSTGPGLYTICVQNDCADAGGRERVKQQSYIYGATFPMNATLHLTRDAKWLLPFSITPLIGAETRNDRNIVYSLSAPATVFQLPASGGSTPFQVNREDGTTFAYGVTGDMTVRWIINETVSAYAGMRVQYINGHDQYLAYGPLVGMSVRFGGK